MIVILEYQIFLSSIIPNEFNDRDLRKQVETPYSKRDLGDRLITNLFFMSSSDKMSAEFMY